MDDLETTVKLSDAKVLKARNSLIGKLATALREVVFKRSRHILNEEELECIIDGWLPMTYAEREAQLELPDKTQKPSKNRKQKPSVMTRLRTALGHDKNIDMLQTIESAIKKIEELKKLKEKQ